MAKNFWSELYEFAKNLKTLQIITKFEGNLLRHCKKYLKLSSKIKKRWKKKWPKCEKNLKILGKQYFLAKISQNMKNFGEKFGLFRLLQLSFVSLTNR